MVDNGIVKLSLPFGDINSVPDTITDMHNAIPKLLKSADWYNKTVEHIIKVEKKKNKVPITVLFDIKTFDL